MEVTTTTISSLVSLASTTDLSGLVGSFQSESAWILVTGFVVALFLAFGVGANDVANSKWIRNSVQGYFESDINDPISK